MSYTPDDIINAHPHLKLEQVHDALSYYYEHRDEIDKKIKQDEDVIQKISQGQKVE
jgi:uncharacterized protein (DUF433 family)